MIALIVEALSFLVFPSTANPSLRIYPPLVGGECTAAGRTTSGGRLRRPLGELSILIRIGARRLRGVDRGTADL